MGIARHTIWGGGALPGKATNIVFIVVPCHFEECIYMYTSTPHTLLRLGSTDFVAVVALPRKGDLNFSHGIYEVLNNERKWYL